MRDTLNLWHMHEGEFMIEVVATTRTRAEYLCVNVADEVEAIFDNLLDARRYCQERIDYFGHRIGKS